MLNGFLTFSDLSHKNIKVCNCDKPLEILHINASRSDEREESRVELPSLHIKALGHTQQYWLPLGLVDQPEQLVRVGGPHHTHLVDVGHHVTSLHLVVLGGHTAGEDAGDDGPPEDEDDVDADVTGGDQLQLVLGGEVPGDVQPDGAVQAELLPADGVQETRQLLYLLPGPAL